jgi:hypothetical protein
MSTNKVVLKSVEAFMSGYTPVYNPIYPLFMKKAKAYPSIVGKNTFKRLNAVGDIRGQIMTPKDNIMKQISVNESSKEYKQYFFLNQYTQSGLQDAAGIEDIVAQVLDEHQKHQDDLFLLGEGTSASTMKNNGLFWSNDPNYRLEGSDALSSTGGHLPAFHTKIMETVALSEVNAGEKLLVIYGSTATSKYDSLYSDNNAPFKQVLKSVLEGWNIIKLPSQVTPAGDGIIACNLDQIVLHHSSFPSLLSQGYDEQHMHSWHNFILGSTMLEVLVDDAIVRQPVTFS